MNPKKFTAERIAGVLVAAAIILFAINSYESHHPYDVDVKPQEELTLIQGIPNAVAFSIDKDWSKTLNPKNLEPEHGHKLHALLLDPEMQDFHHVYPVADKMVHDLYAFSFTPKSSCQYRAWIEVTPSQDKDQFVPVELNGKQHCPVMGQNHETLTAFHNGYQFALKEDKEGLKKLGADIMKLSIADANGKPVDAKLIGMTGFYDDYNSLLMPYVSEDDAIHKINGQVSSNFELHVTPDHTGYVKFFAEVQIGKHRMNIPFTVHVGESKSLT